MEPRCVHRRNVKCDLHVLEYSFSPLNAGCDGAARRPCPIKSVFAKEEAILFNGMGQISPVLIVLGFGNRLEKQSRLQLRADRI
jgi:hypothetical protein